MAIEKHLQASAEEDVVQEFDELDLVSKLTEVPEDYEEVERDGEGEGGASYVPLLSWSDALKTLSATKRVLEA